MRAPIALGLFALATCSAPYAPPREQGGYWARERLARPAPPRTTEPTTDAPASVVVLVTLDGVRWQEIFDGTDPVLSRGANPPIAPRSARALLPNIYRAFVDGGAAAGHPDSPHGICTANDIYLSLPGYHEIFSGRPTGCRHNACGDNPCPTVVSHAHDGTCESVAVFTSWPRLAFAVPRALRASIAISAGRAGDAPFVVARGCNGASLPLDAPEGEVPSTADPGYRPDAETAHVTLQYLASHTPRFVHVGLGDPDEYAHEGNYARYVRSLEEADSFLGRLLALLATRGEWGRRATVMVTADHGRAWNFRDHGYYAGITPMPESDRVFLLMTGHRVPARGLVRLDADHYLADIAPTIAALLGPPAAPASDAVGYAPSERFVQPACSAPRGSALCELVAGVPCEPRASGFRACYVRPR